MSGSTDPFNVQVTRWVEKARMRARLALQATAQDALAKVRELTPVDTGTLRAAWQMVEKGDALPKGTEDGLIFEISDSTLGQTFFIVNPVKYAARIEFGFVGTDSLGRHYNQRGRGMMQKVIAMMPKIAQDATTRIISGAN